MNIQIHKISCVKKNGTRQSVEFKIFKLILVKSLEYKNILKG